MRFVRTFIGLTLLAVSSLTASEIAKDLKVSFGGLIQPSYKLTDSNNSGTVDDVRFRRLRAILKAKLYKNWSSKVMLDFGMENTAIRGAHIKYHGWKNIDFRIGSSLAYFSREILTPNWKQLLVERQHVGSKSYGSPLFQTGFHLKGTTNDKKIWYGGTVAMAAHKPSNQKINLEDTIQIQTSKTDKSDWSDGLLTTFRLGWHPMGPVAYTQGILKKERNFCLEAGVLAWNNDNDNLGKSTSNDLDRLTGYELSFAGRCDRISLDVQYNLFDAKLSQSGVTSGLYKNSETQLEQLSIETGYSIIMSKLEWVLGYQAQDADNYNEVWKKTSTGFNYYIHGHDLKVQVTYTRGESANGVNGRDSDELITQLQISF
jgi:hypothetical protein